MQPRDRFHGKFAVQRSLFRVIFAARQDHVKGIFERFEYFERVGEYGQFSEPRFQRRGRLHGGCAAIERNDVALVNERRDDVAHGDLLFAVGKFSYGILFEPRCGPMRHRPAENSFQPAVRFQKNQIAAYGLDGHAALVCKFIDRGRAVPPDALGDFLIPFFRQHFNKPPQISTKHKLLYGRGKGKSSICPQ